MIAGGLLGIKATLKVDEVIADSKQNLESVREEKELYEVSSEYNKNISLAYLRLIGDITRLYAPAMIVTGVSAYSIIKGNDIFRKRNLALIGACALIEDKIGKYEGYLGKDAAYKIRNGIESKTFEFLETDEKGKEKKVKKEVDVCTEYSIAAKFFCESSRFWEDDPEENLIFLRNVEKDLTDRLRKQGYLKMNEVYRALDVPETDIGEKIGWVIGHGDDFVDLGIYNCYREGNHRFVNGLEPVVLIDPNHHGYILNWI